MKEMKKIGDTVAGYIPPQNPRPVNFEDSDELVIRVTQARRLELHELEKRGEIKVLIWGNCFKVIKL